jgi:hypothetical protein
VSADKPKTGVYRGYFTIGTAKVDVFVRMDPLEAVPVDGPVLGSGTFVHTASRNGTLLHGTLSLVCDKKKNGSIAGTVQFQYADEDSKVPEEEVHRPQLPRLTVRSIVTDDAGVSVHCNAAFCTCQWECRGCVSTAVLAASGWDVTLRLP